MEQSEALGQAQSDEVTGGDDCSASPSDDEQEGGKSDAALRSVSLAQASSAEKLKVCNALAAMFYGVNPVSFEARTRHERRINEARQLGMYLTNICLGVDYEEIARVSNRDRTTVRYSIERVEDRRENPHFDSVLVIFETLIGCLQDREVTDMVENGLCIDYNIIAHVPEAE